MAAFFYSVEQDVRGYCHYVLGNAVNDYSVHAVAYPNNCMYALLRLIAAPLALVADGAWNELERRHSCLMASKSSVL